MNYRAVVLIHRHETDGNKCSKRRPSKSHPSIDPWAQCPLVSSVPSLHHWVSFQATTAGSGIWGFRPCWYPSPFPSPSISWCFSIYSSSPAIGFHSCFFFAAGISAPIRSTLLGEFPGLVLAMVADVVVPEVEQRCATAHVTKISIQISALAG